MSNYLTHTNTQALFCHYPWDDNKSVQKKILDEDGGPHVFFRRVKTAMQARFAQLIDHALLPQVFLCGSPHIDNYAKTDTGCGMIDFDRAHYGPYPWDFICLLVSISLRQKHSLASFVRSNVSDALFAGYSCSFKHPDDPYVVYQPLAKSSMKAWQKSTQAYLKANKKWVKKFRQLPISNNDPLLNDLLRQYFLHRNEPELLAKYHITEAGRAFGSFGRVHNIIVVANHQDPQDIKILDIKHAKKYANPLWPHDEFYNHDFIHEGERMIAASQLYAPGVTAGESYATLNGIEYWARTVPLHNVKIKGRLDDLEQEAFAYAVGTQLGRGHVSSLQVITPEDLLRHLQNHFQEYVDAATTIHEELFIAWRRYCDMLYEK